jgi:hypothetical protein
MRDSGGESGWQLVRPYPGCMDKDIPYIKHILFWTAASHSDRTFVNKASCNTFEKLMLFSSQRVFSYMGMLKVFFTALPLCCLAYSVISTSIIFVSGRAGKQIAG